VSFEAGDDPEARLQAAVSAFLHMIIDTEQQQRAMLRLSLEPVTTPRELPLRKGRAIGWFEDALSPLEPHLNASGEVRVQPSDALRHVGADLDGVGGAAFQGDGGQVHCSHLPAPLGQPDDVCAFPVTDVERCTRGGRRLPR